MPNILINKRTGAMATIPPDGNLGSKEGNKLLSSPDHETIELSGTLADEYLKGNCKYSDGKIVLIPEDEKPELTGLE